MGLGYRFLAYNSKSINGKPISIQIWIRDSCIPKILIRFITKQSRLIGHPRDWEEMLCAGGRYSRFDFIFIYFSGIILKDRNLRYEVEANNFWNKPDSPKIST